ncbi:dipeptidase [Alkalihalobacillus sp. LMS39]|uniref:dipeptidase n=1 Tax=Alkalihalobacillus sp. LMS39 TaxID=2924032 RepID=UPI001FB1DD0C|nr:dipeptidase [Alkalihalobacillus sp. LMS39]UOE92622.1 dipeptidase [Alkalihalobacillus sp. LMS39]
MRVIDTHCDALLKLWEDRRRDFTSNDIETNIHRLREGNVWIQCFAIFVEPTIKNDQKFQVVLDQIQLFFEKVITPNPQMKHIKSWEDIMQLEENETGAILTLEGVDPIGDDLERLKLLYHLGVLSVGLTWNQANLCADGIGEPRGAGLTCLGKDLVSLNNEHRILTDVSHLSEAGFWDVLETAHYPIATHSNAKSLCSHRRNLTDEQLKAMIKKQAPIGVVFHPYFLENEGTATIASIVNHIEHVCSLGGKQQICFGSDFDGIPSTVSGLHHAGDYQNLINELLKHFTEEEVRGFAYQNFLNHLPS